MLIGLPAPPAPVHRPLTDRNRASPLTSTGRRSRSGREVVSSPPRNSLRHCGAKLSAGNGGTGAADWDSPALKAQPSISEARGLWRGRWVLAASRAAPGVGPKHRFCLTAANTFPSPGRAGQTENPGLPGSSCLGPGNRAKRGGRVSLPGLSLRADRAGWYRWEAVRVALTAWRKVTMSEIVCRTFSPAQ